MTHKIKTTRAKICTLLTLSSTAIGATAAHADGLHDLSKIGQAQIGNAQRSDGHAPLGVMGDHMHKKGEWMLSYRYMQMQMNGNISGSSDISAATIATTIPNAFAAMPGQPPTLRIVPTSMEMNMHMLGAMYAPTDDLTLMAMVNYLDNSMDHTTFQGGVGTTIRGGFTTTSSGFGDTKIGGLYRLFDKNNHHMHLNFGLSLPTGSITESGRIFAPNGATPTVRLPYAMQLGSGTFDFLPGLTYTARSGDLTWGAQYRAEMRLESKNSEGYSLGDKHAVSAWVARQWQPWITTSFRIDAMTQDGISGRDRNIMGPVQTANTANYGGQRVDAYFGVNLMGQKGALSGHRLAAEIGVPVYQKANGVQMKSDYSFNLGWQKAF